LSQQVYYNNGYTEPQEFILIKDNNPTTLKETYKFGKFSVNGDFLLTITAKNSIKVYETTSLKTVFEKQLTDGSYSIFNMDDTNFAVSNNYRTIDFNSCNKESFIIAQDTLTKSYSSQKVDCSVIKDISYANDKVAIIMEGYGLVLNSKMHQFPISEFPEHVSLNSDGSKLMISFNNGKIIVYDTENFNPLGTTIHPDKNSHVFLSSEGHYFSNINPEDYIIASKNNQTVALEDIENQFFKPKEVLSVFGTPNKTYVESLEKALQLKSENLYATSIDENVGNDRIIEDSKLPANLFVLSIGVSDYKQTDFNLTFADKDAIDIAKLYGNLTDKELYNYNTKFYGDNFNLINSDSTIVSNIKKYSDISAVYELYPVSMDNSYWIENTYGKFYLWNFNTQTTKPIEFPDNYKPNTISFNETIKINPGNSGFYLISDNGDYFSYNFKTGITEKIELPFTEDNILTEPLDKGRWSNFSSSYNDTTYVGNLTIGKTNSSQTSTLSFNLNVVDTFNEKDEIVRDTLDLLDVSNVTFKGISTNAKHLAYSSYENLFIVDLSEEKPIPLKLNIDKDLIRYGSTLHISNDGQSFSILNRFKDDYKYNITSFNRNGEVQANYKLNGENDYSIVGLNLINNNLKWIQQTEPLLQENKYSIDKFRTKTPSSFEKTHINYLTNRNATSKSIISELKDLAENTKPNDQVIVFLAGHGVLDKDLNYYFAPHDMDFNNVSTHGIALNTIIENLKNSPSENKLLLMDSCHSGNTLDMSKSEVVIVDNSKDPNKRGSKARSTSPRSKFKVSDVVSTLFEDFLSTSGITILSASSGEDVAYENKAIGNGAFTSSYIKLLKQELQGNGYVIDESNLESSIDLTNDIIEELLKEVMIITKGKQVPDLRELNKNSKLKMW